MNKNFKNPPIEVIQSSFLNKKEITISVKREDLIHEHISGNKWRKLKYNVKELQKQNFNTLLTFGGAYSNHIYAVASIGALFNINTIGIIRGERIEPLNSTLSFAENKGMKLHFVDRTTYRKKDSLAFLETLKQQFNHPYIVPEGGTNLLALKGTAEIVSELTASYDYICVACGTGGTLAGMIVGANHQGQLLGFSALKGDFLTKDIQQLIHNYNGTIYSNWKMINDYHFGGYARIKPKLIQFMNEFKQTYQIPLEPIYTGKMFYGIFDLIKKDFFPKGASILAIHTGGLQGIAGINQRFGNVLV